MKPYAIRKIVLLLSLLLTAAACDKMPDNGALDGFWQLMSVERGGVAEATKESQTFWAIRSRLVQLASNGGPTLFAHFTREGDTLTLYDLCHAETNRTDGAQNEWITPQEGDILAAYGLNAVSDTTRPGRLRQTFRIVRLNSSTMLLSSADCRLTFRKF